MTNAGSHREPLCIDAAHPSFAGHFPGRPVVPGVVLLDGVLEAAQRLFGLSLETLRMPQVKFLQPLLPRQTAEVAFEQTAVDAGHARIRFRIERDGALLVSGELIAAVPIAVDVA